MTSPSNTRTRPGQNASANYRAAVMWVLLSTGIFSLVFASAKFADGAASTAQILLLRYISGYGVVLWVASRWGGIRNHLRLRPKEYGLRAFYGVAAAAAITWASARMPIADATALGMLYAVLSVLLGILVLKERVGRGHWTAIFLSVIGAAVVMWGQGAFQAQVPILPAAVAFLSALLMAAEGLMIVRLSRRDPALTMMVSLGPYAIGLMLLPALLTWQPLDLATVLMCLALGPVATFAQYCTIRGFRIAPLSVVGPVDNAWLIFAALIGFFVFDERPGIALYLGGALILAGGIMLSRLQPKSSG